jgi:hypothetical protein
MDGPTQSELHTYPRNYYESCVNISPLSNTICNPVQYAFLKSQNCILKKKENPKIATLMKKTFLLLFGIMFILEKNLHHMLA